MFIPQLSEETREAIKEKAEYNFYKEMLNLILEEWSVYIDRIDYMRRYNTTDIGDIIEKFERFSDDERTKENLKTLSIFR